MYIPTESKYNDNLICNNCVNDYLIQSKSLNTEKERDSNTKLFLNDSMNKLNHEMIEQKIKEREILSNRASKSIDNFRNVKKELLADEFQNKESFLDKRRDYQVERAIDTHKKNELTIQNNIEKFVTREKPELQKYYKYCVE